MKKDFFEQFKNMFDQGNSEADVASNDVYDDIFLDDVFIDDELIKISAKDSSDRRLT